jgi:hypothetical protein
MTPETVLLAALAILASALPIASIYVVVTRLGRRKACER